MKSQQFIREDVTVADYLAVDGSLPFAKIVEGWEHGETKVTLWQG